jgi:Uma2 family endonuclease
MQEAPKEMTVEAFFAWEGEPHERYELVDGELRTIAPTSPTEGIMKATAAFLLGTQCEASNAQWLVGMNVGIVPRGRSRTNCRVADIAVTRSRITADQLAFPDPILIIEILSSDNIRKVRESIRAFMTIPSVREILAIDSTRIGAELLRCQGDGSWPENPEKIESGGMVRFDSIGLECRLRDFYAGTPLGR